MSSGPRGQIFYRENRVKITLAKYVYQYCACLYKMKVECLRGDEGPNTSWSDKLLQVEHLEPRLLPKDVGGDSKGGVGVLRLFRRPEVRDVT